MNIGIIILFTIYLIAILFLVFVSIRNEFVCRFRLKMIDENYDKYCELPSYERMLFSFKPLKEKYWINQEDI